jgi:GT2 family glycosyltransferase
VRRRCRWDSLLADYRPYPAWAQGSEARLPCCPDSVAAEGEVELLVVDNGSVDGTVELFERRGIPPVTLEENHGFAGAVNLAGA